MIIRSHLPWPLRWAVAALVLGFSAALALWAFEVGKDLAGVGSTMEDELSRLHAEVLALRAERDRAQSLANAADGLLKAERTAQERLAQELRQSEERRQLLEGDLSFFERLLPSGGGQPMQVRALQAETLAPGQTRYQMLVMQVGKPGQKIDEFRGRYEIVLVGTLDGRPWRSAPAGEAKPLKMRQYVRVEGLIDHPPQVVLQTIQARVSDLEGGLRATGTVKLP